MDYDAQDLQSVLSHMRGRHGAGVFEEPRRMISILLDLAPELKRDGNVLRQMSEAGLLRELRKASESGAHEQARVVTKSYDWLTDYLQLSDERAGFYVTALKTLYGLTAETPASAQSAAPPPKPQPNPAPFFKPKAKPQPQSAPFFKPKAKPQPAPPKPTASAIDSGRTGDCAWTLDSDGVLTISGQGEMGNYDYPKNSPFPLECSGAIDSVIIEDGVTQIGNGAFRFCLSLTSVEIPDSVTQIGAQAFYGCVGLSGVDIPGGVTQIGAKAFYGCAGLSSVNIPDSVTQIGDEAFLGCKRMKTVSIPAHTAIGRNAFGKFFSFQTAVTRR